MKKSELSNYLKFREFKVYGTDEWYANDEKKYRTVFEQMETTYVWTEFSFYNKLFDERNWNLSCSIKAFRNSDNSLICDQDASMEIVKELNIVYIRKGWGMESAGAFWTAGSYRWEAWINDELFTTTEFTVNNYGIVTAQENPYFTVKHIKTFESGYNEPAINDRVYYGQFDSEGTRYVWVEFTFENKLNYSPTKSKSWKGELFFNYSDDTGRLKGTVTRNIDINLDTTEYTLSVGWGSETAGTWGKDNFRMAVVFMDQVVAVAPFTVADSFISLEEYTPYTGLNTLTTAGSTTAAITPPETIESVTEELESMVGLNNIKQKLKEYIQYLNFLKIRSEKGFSDSTRINLHAVFTGNPGTGKTTVANLLGKIYKVLGLLPRGHVHEVDRSDIVGEYIGQTAPKIKDAIGKAQGGILFIDEAYSLTRSKEDGKDFGQEVIEILVKEMNDPKNNFAVIVAGYPELMEKFLDFNPGLKSRFTAVYHFLDYTPQELILIADYAANKRSVTLETEARDFLYTRIVEDYRNRDETFGNARLVHSLIEEAKMNLGLRLMKSPDISSLTKEDFATIKVEDIKKIFAQKDRIVADIPIDEDLLRESLAELKAMVGLDSVKKEIDELVKLVRFYRETGRDVRKTFSLHAVFSGNPGTGKTTVARIVAKIYKALGILERGHLVEVDRQKLIASYLGQTAEKTNAVIDKSIGGILFIDEAYALTTSGDDYGREAVEAILKRMEDQRGQFVVIVAGYTDQMEQFLNSNPGLRSRFDRHFFFQDYDEHQLMQMALSLLAVEKLKPDAEAQEYLERFFTQIVSRKGKNFGNGRQVRKVIEASIKNQHLRLATLSPSLRTPEALYTLILDDVDDLILEEPGKNRSSIGFGQTQ